MTIGILGGGQLGYMLALAGYPLGLHFRFLDPSPEAPVGRIANRVTADFNDQQALEKFSHGLEVVTYEFENVPVAAAKFLAERVPVYPPAVALEEAQERLQEKRLFRRLEIPTTEFAEVAKREDLDAAVKQVGLPAMLKTCRMGYDGKGQWLLRTAEEVERARAELPDVPLILEKFVAFARELSILGVRGRGGEIAFYPLIENHHRGGILRLSLAPAPDLTASLQQEAEHAARKVLEELGYVGVLCIEFFEVGGQLLANEMAPRVHNSGHWTIEGAATSQFENHLRAILGMPLGSTAAVGVSAMINLIGEIPNNAEVLNVSNTHLHLYGKEPRAGRKLGHVTVRADQAEKLQQRLSALPEFFRRPEYCLEKALPELLAKRA
ncbi:MAG TPA: 5-(carboxyamino)imidazole ribonucleotide synthase [Candidatus Acidoferrales bacterium]|jgi:5-(carboxyamino)imidazole ribonucleotide synthase|nr:5-(carboxyamino)imidazole ribonucleotide synthase [Candidatus Acidoferrales bacterium]